MRNDIPLEVNWLVEHDNSIWMVMAVCENDCLLANIFTSERCYLPSGTSCVVAWMPLSGVHSFVYGSKDITIVSVPDMAKALKGVFGNEKPGTSLGSQIPPVLPTTKVSLISPSSHLNLSHNGFILTISDTHYQ